jgi:hypothetical protein
MPLDAKSNFEDIWSANLVLKTKLRKLWAIEEFLDQKICNFSNPAGYAIFFAHVFLIKANEILDVVTKNTQN